MSQYNVLKLPLLLIHTLGYPILENVASCKPPFVIQKHTSHLEQLQKIFIKGLDEHGVDYVLNGSEHRIPGSFSVSFPHKEGEAILHRLDLMGVAVTTGSACNSKETEVSHVLKAIALPEKLALGTVRFTFGFDNTEDEVRYVVSCLAKIVA